MRESILQLPEDAWRPAIRQDGQERDGAQIAEITHVERLDLTPWPDGSRVIIRRERPHPGAQLKFTDADGHRFQATLTDLTGDMVEIERLHRGRGDAENLIRGAKQTGLENLPFREFDLNAVWLELSLIAQDLIAWTQRLCLERRARDLRTESAPLPAAAHRRPALLPRPPRGPAPPGELAMGQRARRRVRATTRAAITRWLIPGAKTGNTTIRSSVPAPSADDPLSRKPRGRPGLNGGPGSTSGRPPSTTAHQHRLTPSGAINCHLPAATARSGLNPADVRRRTAVNGNRLLFATI